MWQKTKNFYHLIVAILVNALFRFPGKKLKIIGVTGTDGKTTTTALIYHILKFAGLPVSMISTTGAIIADKEYPLGFHVTTPSSFRLQQFIRKAVNSSRSSYLVLEVTSHALDQKRIWGIPFAVGVITNVTSEHMDYHKTYDNYLQTKAKLLQKADIAILNKDDSSYEKLSKNLEGFRKKIMTYSLMHDADITKRSLPFTTKLVGKFNEYNILAAGSASLAVGVEKKVVSDAISTFIPPLGRGDIVYEKDFNVMIDFAHPPNAFEQLLTTLRSLVSGKIIHVFGTAGERDRVKRPVMGEISARFSDVIILTSEDPRGEEIEKIMDEIELGITGKKKAIRIPDRKEAIRKAISMAKKGDFVLLTGKAHEKSMNYGHGEEEWNEFEEAERVLKSLNLL